jgi:hypothetical protein
MSSFENERVDTGIEEAVKDGMPAADGFSNSGELEQQSS